MTIKKQYLGVGALALAHLAVTFATDRYVFTVPATENLTDYIICKGIVFAILLAFYYGLYLVIFAGKTEILFSALPYLAVIAAVCFFKLRQGFLSNDEFLIYQNAVSLTHYTWFTYITVYFYIVALMLIPHMYGPIFLKLIIELLVVGYVVTRVRRHFGRVYGYFSYLLFLLYPVLAYTTSAHRLPVYFLVYLYLMAMLLFDYLEQAPISRGKLVWILFLSAILTQWRTEGIYFAVISLILIFITYPALIREMRVTEDGGAGPSGLSVIKPQVSFIKVLAVILGSFVIQYLVWIPQNGVIASEMSAKADDRMKPFYAYTVTNMFRNGLDREKNKEDIAIIDRYLSVEKIDAINEYYGDINYEDVLILYAEGFVGVREEAGFEEFFAYADACKRLFINNPDVLLRTRWGAFCYAALPYHIEYTGNSAGELLKTAFSIFKSLSYNLFLPVGILILICLYSLFKREWFLFFSTGGLLAHGFIVFVLAPASYFKYYFPIYMMAYFYVMVGIMEFVYNFRKGRNNSREAEKASQT